MILTPQFQATKLAYEIGLNQPLFIKREDLHPLGSHKGRSIPLMIEKSLEKGVSNFVISSSGNSALSAIKYIQGEKKKEFSPSLKLTIFVGKKIQPSKLNRLKREIKSENIEIIQTDKPKQTAFQLGKKDGIKFLRQSTDDMALKGYTNLAQELSEIKNLDAVFIPTSSGTTAQGIFEGFKKYNLKPQIHIVQTDFCHPIAGYFWETTKDEKKLSIAGAIVDKVAHRKEKVINLIKKTNGLGWIVNNLEIKQAQKLIKENTNLEVSPNSALALAGLIKAIKNNWEFNGTVVILLTGD